MISNIMLRINGKLEIVETRGKNRKQTKSIRK